MGDVKLAFLMGAALGLSVTVALFVGMLAALVPSIVLLARHGKAARKMGDPLRAVPRPRLRRRALRRAALLARLHALGF